MTFRILQLTDLHVFAEPHATLKGIPTRESLQDVVDYILQNEAPFDCVIVTGDHTHDEQPASYQAVQKILSPWNDRIFQVPGNHDDRAVLRQVFADRISSEDGAIQFRREAGSWLLLGLDTHWPGEVAGQFDEAQAAWLQAELKSSAAACVALFCHHPPVDVNSEWMDAIGLHGRERLQAVVESDSRIQLICCGHVHHEFRAGLGTATVVTSPSTGIQFDPAGSQPNFAADAAGYRVIELNDQTFRTHVSRLPEIRYTPADD